jgi:hypothetical protein
MIWLFFGLVLLVTPAVAQQQQQKPNAAQVVDQIMENELRNYRQHIGTLVEQINKCTDERAELQKQLDAAKVEKGKQ